MAWCDDCGLRWTERGPSTLRAPVHVPQTHTLFVGPPACARRHALGGIAGGVGAHQSYLSLDDVALACGDTQRLVVEAVARIREMRPERPRGWFVWLRCVHDMTGVDSNGLARALEQAHPAERFVVCSMNPIAMDDGRPAPGLDIRRAAYRLIEPSPARDFGVVAVGAGGSVDADAFAGSLRAVGLGPLRSLETCATFEDYQRMGRSRLVVAFGERESYVGEGVAAHLGVPLARCGADEAPAVAARRCMQALGEGVAR